MALKFLWDPMILSTDRNNCCHKWSCMVKGSCFYPLLWLYSMWPPWEIKSKGIRRFSHPRLLVENIGFRSTPTCVNLLTCKDNYCAYHHTNFYKLFYNNSYENEAVCCYGFNPWCCWLKKGISFYSELRIGTIFGLQMGFRSHIYSASSINSE